MTRPILFVFPGFTNYLFVCFSFNFLTHISHNFILNGPTIGHTSSLFPFIDNDDGSAYFSAVGNVGIYGGGKNYLGHDKRWADNLIIFPDHWAGDPCVQIWGGPEHYFVGNECVVGTSLGDGCMPGCAGESGNLARLRLT